tara:strand:- start:1451 stop:1924 length:474 start_codon:yes stop_codon:yes gene_type:complete
MITVETESPLNGGLVRRRYQVTLTDLLGIEHTEVVGMFNHTPENDGSEVEAQLFDSKKQQEIELYKSDIINSTNPFMDYEFIWNEKTVLLKAVLDDALSFPATDPIVYNGLPYLSLVTDAELMFLYNKNQTWVDSLRQKVSELLTAKSILDNYQAVL